jgi:chromosome partitioning protein
MADKYLELDEIKRILKLTTPSIQTLVDDGHLKGYNRGQGLAFLQSEVVGYLEEVLFGDRLKLEGRTTGVSRTILGSRTAFPSLDFERDRREGRIIAVSNHKGGCGKTTTVISIAGHLAKRGYRTLIVDLDPQANATIGTGVNADNVPMGVVDVLGQTERMLKEIVVPTELPNLDLAPTSSSLTLSEVSLDQTLRSKFALKNSLGTLPQEYSYILLDCPPSLSLLTLNALTACSEVLIPVQTHYYALQGVGQLLKVVELVKRIINPRLEVLGFLPTMYDVRTNMGKRVLVQMYEQLKDYYIFKTVIRVNVTLQEAASHGVPIIKYAKYSRGAREYETLTREVMERGKVLAT